jgi:CheY-like chemotaxis protein
MGRDRKHVLVVDNDENVLLQLEHALETEGYQTTTAWSGQQALDLLAQRSFDLVVLDDQLSDSSAEELLKQLCSCRRSIPVIVTQNPGAAPCTAERYLSQGASAVVCKCPPREIQVLVDQLLPVACL